MRKLLILAAVAAILLPGLASAEEDGKALYASKCAMCHGKDGVGNAMSKGSRHMNDAEFQKSMTVEDIVKVITDGKNKMPPNKDKLTAEQIQAIAAHVKTMGPAE